MKKLLMIVVLVLAGCTNADGAREALSAAGYTNVAITGWEWFGCGSEDDSSTGFTATGLNGTKVTGVVCGGLFFKGATIRVKRVEQ